MISALLSPITILFSAILIGHLLGILKFKNISLGIAGVLIAAIAIGMFLSRINIACVKEFILDNQFESKMKLFSSLGTSLFVTCIGMQSGYSFKKNNIFCFFSGILGMLIVLANIAIMHIFTLFDRNVLADSMFGIFCGAMTSTPGLAALSNNHNANLENATIGYASSYIIGLITIVLFTQIITRKIEPLDIDKIERSVSSKKAASNIFIFGQISLSIIIGNILGNIYIPFINIKVGNTCGILIFSILFSYITKKININFVIAQDKMNLIRDLGLVLFFVGTGVPAGTKAIDNFSLEFLLYGFVFSIFPIIIGFLVGKHFFGERIDNILSFICGIMTSTPAISLLLQKTKDESNILYYTATYTGALLTIVISANFI